jgi:hypothetical protein
MIWQVAGESFMAAGEPQYGQLEIGGVALTFGVTYFFSLGEKDRTSGPWSKLCRLQFL